MKNLVCTLLLLASGVCLSFAQSEGILSVGVSYGHAFEWEYNDAFLLSLAPEPLTGNFFSFFGDLAFTDKILGRGQLSVLQASSLNNNQVITSGFLVTGALGYHLYQTGRDRAPGKLQVPILLAAGYGKIKRNRINNPSDFGAHYGIILAPQYYLTSNLALHASYRYLIPYAIDGGSEIGSRDFSVGLLFTL